MISQCVGRRGRSARASGDGDLGAGDRGAASVLMAAVVLAVVLALGAGFVAAQLLVARSQARVGADLAALAAAHVARDAAAMGEGVVGGACAKAREAAHLNGVSVTQCGAEGMVVTVTVEAGSGVARAYASASAGPAYAQMPSAAKP